MCSNFLKSDVDFNERDTMYMDFLMLHNLHSASVFSLL